MFNTNKNLEKGISLYLSIMILAILMIIAFGMSAILISEMNVMTGMGRSVIAFFAAESGIEKALLEAREGIPVPPTISGELNNQSTYEASVIAPGVGNCPPPPVVSYCIKSVGSYLGSRRAIWVTR